MLITLTEALDYFNNNICEVYGIDYEGIESLLQVPEDFDNFEMFVIDKI